MLARNIKKTEGIGSTARAAENAKHARERDTGGAITKIAKGGTEEISGRDSKRGQWRATERKREETRTDKGAAGKG